MDKPKPKMMTMKTRSYSVLITHRSFEDRFNYLSLRGSVGRSTFGFDRYLNQKFYTSRQWKQIRDEILARDLGCDLGCDGYEVFDRPIIHHMNPLLVDDVERDNPDNLNPEYLITTSHRTHNAIHYGDASLLPQPLVERRPGDTQLWSRLPRKVRRG